jgi:hypothetical protein
LHFQQISRTVVYNIVTDTLDFWKLCSHWMPKMLFEEHEKKTISTRKIMCTVFLG